MADRNEKENDDPNRINPRGTKRKAGMDELSVGHRGSAKQSVTTKTVDGGGR